MSQNIMKVIVQEVDGVKFRGEFPKITEGNSTHVVFNKGKYYVITDQKGVKATCQKLMSCKSFAGAGYVIQSSSGEWWLMPNADVEAQGGVPPSVQDAGGAEDSSSDPPPCSIGGGGGGGSAAPVTAATDSTDVTEAPVTPFRIDDAALGSYDGKTYFKLTVGLKEPDEPDATKSGDVDVKTPNKEVLMLLPDVSGSMASSSGAGTTRMDELKKAMHYIIDHSKGQQVVMVPWSDEPYIAFNRVIDENTKEIAHETVDKLCHGGGTNMLEAIRSAGERMRELVPGVPIHLIMLTDGEPNCSLRLIETSKEAFKDLDLIVTTIGLNVDCNRRVLDLETGIPTAIEDPNRRNFLFVGEATESLTVQLAQLLAVQAVETQAVHIKVSFPAGVEAEAVEGGWNPGPDNTFEQTGKISTMSEIKAMFRLRLPDSGLCTQEMILVEASDPEEDSLYSRHEIPFDGRPVDTDYKIGVLIENQCLKTLLNQHTKTQQVYGDLLARLRKIPGDKLDDWSRGELTRLRDQLFLIIENLGTKQQEHVLAAGSSNYKTGSSNYRSRSAQVSAAVARGSSSGYNHSGDGGGGSSSSDSMDQGSGSMSHRPTSHRRRVKLSQTLWSDRGGAGGGGGGGGGGYRS
jgi:hypothetical protein